LTWRCRRHGLGCLESALRYRRWSLYRALGCGWCRYDHVYRWTPTRAHKCAQQCGTDQRCAPSPYVHLDPRADMPVHRVDADDANADTQSSFNFCSSSSNESVRTTARFGKLLSERLLPPRVVAEAHANLVLDQHHRQCCFDPCARSLDGSPRRSIAATLLSVSARSGPETLISGPTGGCVAEPAATARPRSDRGVHHGVSPSPSHPHHNGWDGYRWRDDDWDNQNSRLIRKGTPSGVLRRLALTSHKRCRAPAADRPPPGVPGEKVPLGLSGYGDVRQ
jgi:hypothetical protein